MSDTDKDKSEEYKIIHSLHLYTFNVSLEGFALDIFNEGDFSNAIGPRQEYIRDFFNAMQVGKLWGKLDCNNRQRLIEASQRRFPYRG
jgi:hypothetical protein